MSTTKMAYSGVSFDHSRIDFYRHVTLDVSSYLQSLPGVVDLKLDERYGCETLALVHWEQLNGFYLPDEIKNFYLATNGFELTWKFRIADQTFSVGNMHINVLSELTALNEPWKADRHDKDLTRLFVINGNVSQGYIVLMLTKGSSSASIHYLNSNGHLFQIADNLATYIRLMVLYLGLPDWPLIHLKMDLSYWNKQLYTYFTPYLVQKRAESDELENRLSIPVNVLDSNIFKANKTPR